MSDLPYIIAAYAATWIVLLGYTLYLTIRSHRATASLTARPSEPPDV